MRFEGKRVVVTGASRGIGRVVTIDLIAEGAKVIAVARNQKDLESTRDMTSKPDNVDICVADLRSTEAIDSITKLVHERGPLDIIMNIAGVWHDDERKFQGRILSDTPMSEIDDVMGVGLRGSILLTRALLPDLVNRRSGKVLFVACGFAGAHEASGWVHYYVTNKAIEALTAGLASELRKYRIQVNCVAPWYVATEAVRRFYPNDFDTALDPKEISTMALFLCSPAAENISGQTVELRSVKDPQTIE